MNFRSALPATIVALLICPAGSRSQIVAPDSVIRLPIRVHLLGSTESQALTTTWTEREVRQLLDIANEVWARAGLQWVVESILEEEAPNGEVFDSLLAGRVPRTGENQRSVIPRDALLEHGWDLFLIRDYGRIAGGVFWPEVPAVVLAQRGMGVDLDPSGRGGRTLAHELGHSLLGLGHVDCVPASPNIMAVACWRPGFESTLTDDQIRRARVQASAGRPITVESERPPRLTGTLASRDGSRVRLAGHIGPRDCELRGDRQG